jgi:DNA-binding MarR family transcriptional regulator
LLGHLFIGATPMRQQLMPPQQLQVATSRVDGHQAAPDSSQRSIHLSKSDVEAAVRLLELLTTRSTEENEAEASRHELIQAGRDLLRFRALRSDILPSPMFGEPAWDILLILYCGLDGQRPSITALADLIKTPTTSVIRWVGYLEAQCLVTRVPCPFDRRVALVELTEKATASLDWYLSQTVKAAS